ncbi:threonine/serine ThrE exporter family protein [Schleiferilactobacillus perolens]|uniref:threonine/serine ThrE exporter family protein n=1 Tax=Schleiferilactobacillus perolens TaxID=100468 RepID=UPI0039EAC868
MDDKKHYRLKSTWKLSERHHMAIPWDQLVREADLPAVDAGIAERSAIVGRIGIILLSCGTGAWRVREAMNTVARSLGLTCSADIGLISIEYTCFSPTHHYSQVLSLSSSGVNTDKLDRMERFVHNFDKKYANLTLAELHQELDRIQTHSGNYSVLVGGLAAALACSAFVFLLGGGLVEMFCAFIGAGIGNLVRGEMIHKQMTILACVGVGVAAACLSYGIVFQTLVVLFHVAAGHEAGYIGAMLFVIPGFPFITSMLDISKLDMRSGMERLAFAIMVTTVASLVGWLFALMVQLRPGNFLPLSLGPVVLCLLRVAASFCGVYGFSIMFNSPQRMAITAGLVGAVANTLRLELVDLTAVPPAAAAFVGALVAGLLASLINRYEGYSRISLTVPSIVIMVPGLYIYRAVYNIGSNSLSVGAMWLTRAALIIMFLPMGLFLARLLLDKKWRQSD